MDIMKGSDTGKDKVVLSWKLPAIVILVAATISAAIIAGSFYLESHEEVIKDYLPGNNASASQSVEKFMEPVAMAVAVGAFLLIFGTMAYRIGKFRRDYRKLETSGMKAYCRVTKAEEIRTNSKSGPIEYKRVAITTPMGKVGIYELPIESPVREGDSILIMYDPSDADRYFIVREKGDAVIRKRSA